MNVVLNATWRFELNSPETVLVIKALQDRLTNDDLEAARALGDQIAAMRAKTTSQLADQMAHNHAKTVAKAPKGR